MKVVFPKNIQKGMLAGMSFQIGPINLTIVQLFLVGIGVAAAFGIFNVFSKAGGKTVGMFFAIIVLLIFAFIAFFKMSELSLLPFVAKLIRNLFFDTPKKYQTNFSKHHPFDLTIKKMRSDDEGKQIVEHKSGKIDKEIIKKINQEGLL